MLTPKLYSRLCREGYRLPEGIGNPQEVAESIDHALAVAPVLVCDDVAQIFAQKRTLTSGYALDNSPLQLAPPFQCYWMETVVESGRLGLLFVNEKTQEGWSVIATGVAAFPGKPVLACHAQLSYDLQANGVLPLGYFGVGAARLVGRGYAAMSDEEVFKMIFGLYGSLLDAHGLLHCQNAALSDGAMAAADAAKASRRFGRRGDHCRYHTVTIDGESVGGGGRGEPAEVMPLHTVRGHFATYTPDRPLFGRFIGTFWVRDHVRGKEANGRVVKNYRLAGNVSPTD